MKRVKTQLLIAIGAAACFLSVCAHKPPLPRRPASTTHALSFFLKRGQVIPPEWIADTFDVPSTCRALWTELLALDLNRFGEPVLPTAASDWTNAPVDNQQGAQKAIAEIFDRHPCSRISAVPGLALLKRYTLLAARQCRSSTAATCLDSLFWVRHLSAEYLTQEIPLERIADIGTLTAKLFGLARNASTKTHAIAACIAERILELEPGNLEAARLALRFRYLDLIARPEAGDAVRAFEKAVFTLEGLEKLEWRVI